MPRFHCPTPLVTGELIDLPPGAARHVQVLRLQPGAQITLFHGAQDGGEFEATVTRMGRSDVQVLVGAHQACEREAARDVHLVVGVPANERMDWLVEKATELGAASIQPVFGARGVLRLSGERADKKRLHWQGVAVAACEQCGRNRVPIVHAALGFEDWARAAAAAPRLADGCAMLLSLRAGSRPLRDGVPACGPVTFMSGPEGGFTPAEEEAALAAGFQPVTLGPRVLRAETAPLAALAALTLFG